MSAPGSPRQALKKFVSSIVLPNRDFNDTHEISHPWNRFSYHKRVQTFSLANWAGYPASLSPLEAARWGWENAGLDLIKCKTCSQLLCFAITKGTESIEVRRDIYAVYTKRLNEGHNSACFWRNNPCPQSLASITLKNRPEERRRFLQRLRSIQSLIGEDEYELPPGVAELLLAGSEQEANVAGELHTLLSRRSSMSMPLESRGIVTPAAEKSATPSRSSTQRAIMESMIGSSNALTVDNHTSAITQTGERSNTRTSKPTPIRDTQGTVLSSTSDNDVTQPHTEPSPSADRVENTARSQSIEKTSGNSQTGSQTATPLMLALAVAGWESDATASDNRTALVCRYCQRTLTIPAKSSSPLLIQTNVPVTSSDTQVAASSGPLQERGICLESIADDPADDTDQSFDTHKRRRPTEETSTGSQKRTKSGSRRVLADPITAHRTYCPWVQPVVCATPPTDTTQNEGWRVYRDFLLAREGLSNQSEGVTSSPSQSHTSLATTESVCAKQAAEKVLAFIKGVTSRKAGSAPVRIL